MEFFKTCPPPVQLLAASYTAFIYFSDTFLSTNLSIDFFQWGLKETLDGLDGDEYFMDSGRIYPEAKTKDDRKTKNSYPRIPSSLFLLFASLPPALLGGKAIL